jgi:NTP pyrophosphatase (non-canonical NTP hydrolase)
VSDVVEEGMEAYPTQVGTEQVKIRTILNLFSAQTSAGAREKGFHQAFEDADFLEELAKELNANGGEMKIDFAEIDRLEDIAKRVRLLEVGMKMMLIVSELAEGLESLRDTGYDGHLDGKGNLGEELADAGIRLGDLAGMVETRLGDDITDKMAVNKHRPYRHGRHA